MQTFTSTYTKIVTPTKVYNFVNGIYKTNNKSEIEELSKIACVDRVIASQQRKK